MKMKVFSGKHHPGLGWFPDKEELEEIHREYRANELIWPVITRYLNQRQLHQLAIEMMLQQTSGSFIVILEIFPGLGYYINQTDKGWHIDIKGRSKIDCENLECLEKFFDQIVIEGIYYLTALGANNIPIYDGYFPFFRSIEQKSTLEKFLPKEAFDYPIGKIDENKYLSRSREEYLKRLEAENRELKETIGEIIPSDLLKIVSGYRQPSKDIEIRRLLEAKLAKGSLVADYLGLK